MIKFHYYQAHETMCCIFNLIYAMSFCSAALNSSKFLKMSNVLAKTENVC